MPRAQAMALRELWEHRGMPTPAADDTAEATPSRDGSILLSCQDSRTQQPLFRRLGIEPATRRCARVCEATHTAQRVRIVQRNAAVAGTVSFDNALNEQVGRLMRILREGPTPPKRLFASPIPAAQAFLNHAEGWAALAESLFMPAPPPRRGAGNALAIAPLLPAAEEPDDAKAVPASFGPPEGRYAIQVTEERSREMERQLGRACAAAFSSGTVYSIAADYGQAHRLTTGKNLNADVLLKRVCRGLRGFYADTQAATCPLPTKPSVETIDLFGSQPYAAVQLRQAGAAPPQFPEDLSRVEAIACYITATMAVQLMDNKRPLLRAPPASATSAPPPAAAAPVTVAIPPRQAACSAIPASPQPPAAPAGTQNEVALRARQVALTVRSLTAELAATVSVSVPLKKDQLRGPWRTTRCMGSSVPGGNNVTRRTRVLPPSATYTLPS